MKYGKIFGFVLVSLAYFAVFLGSSACSDKPDHHNEFTPIVGSGSSGSSSSGSSSN